MCTVTWTWIADGYHLVFNRDELKTRQPALPPRQRSREGVRYLAPTDGDAGGTWIALNEHGVTVCLLNRHPLVRAAPSLDAEALSSRGHLVAALADLENADELGTRLAAFDLTTYRPFTLLAIDPGHHARKAIWDGGTTRCETARSMCPISSSSRDEQGADRARQDVFSRTFGQRDHAEADELLAFHRSHAPEPGAYSPCMHRDDAETLSLCLLEVRQDEVRFTYADGPPCTAPLTAPLVLSRHHDRAASAV